MSDLNAGDTGAPDTPEEGDVDTTSMYGTVPDDTPGDELGTSEEEQLGTEENLTTPRDTRPA